MRLKQTQSCMVKITEDTSGFLSQTWFQIPKKFWQCKYLMYCIFQHQQKGSEGQQQQLKMTSDVTSKFPWCCRASVSWSGKEVLDVASDDPPDEALSCRRRTWDVPYNRLFFPLLMPLACGRQSRCLGWTYKLPRGQKFSIKLSALSVGFPLRRPLKLIKRPEFTNSPGVGFINHPKCSL